MDQLTAGILMLFPAIFVLLLIAGGLIMLVFWVFHYLQATYSGMHPKRTNSLHVSDRRSGKDRRSVLGHESPWVSGAH